MLDTLSEGILVFVAHKEVTLSLAIFFILLLGVISVSLEQGEKTRLPFFLLVFFSLSILLRLAFLSDVIVPSYFDSVTHVRVANALLEGFKHRDLPPLSSLTAGYYHLGFHWVVSLLALGLRADLINVMLIFGQITLAALPIPLFLLIYQHTASKTAALLTAILAGFGWYMPSLLIDWGKYPAITSLLFFELVLYYAYLLTEPKQQKYYGISFILLLAGMLFTFYVHSRMSFVILISFASWVLAVKANNLPQKHQASVFRILLLLIVGIIFYTQQNPLLTLTFEPYFFGAGGYSTAILLFFSIFAFREYRQGVYFCLLFMLGILAALYIPFSVSMVNLPARNLLDRPFVEMIFHLPLSLMGGLGFAGFVKRMERLPVFNRSFFQNLFIFLLISFLSFFMIKNHRFHPSGCCTLVYYDDTIMMDWIAKNLPDDTRILVAANPLEVMPDAKSSGLVGSDAGVWLPYFTRREILPFPYTADFSNAAIRQQLCQSRVDYIYVGANAQSFNDKTFLENKHWYKEVISLPHAGLFAIEDCP